MYITFPFVMLSSGVYTDVVIICPPISAVNVA